jgi:hypothetical protein
MLVDCRVEVQPTMAGRAARPILLYASEIPAIVALSHFRPINEVFTSVWKRVDTKGFSQATSALASTGFKVQDPAQKIQSMIVDLQLNDAVGSAMAAAADAQDASQLAAAKEVVATALAATNAPLAVQQRVKDAVVSDINKEYGTRQEDASAQQYQAVLKAPVKVCNMHSNRNPSLC